MMTSPVNRILVRAQPGSRGGVRQHVARGEILRAKIAARFGIDRPEQWRAKHIRWALEHGLPDLSNSTRYHYYRTARAIAAALGHWPNWQPYLLGPWTTPAGSTPDRGGRRGGRPPKLAARGNGLFVP